MAKEVRVNKNIDQLLEDFRDQMMLLEDSSRSFDNEKYREAKRIAVSLRILLCDEGMQKSLLSQLNIKGIPLLDTSSGYSKNNLLTQTCLLMMRLGSGGGKYLPHFDNLHQKRFIPFDSWWNGIVIADKKRNTITRGKLIRFMADEDGGAHVDAALSESYYDLKYNNSLVWVHLKPDGEERPLINDPAQMTIRQISYELMYSLKTSKNPIIKNMKLSDLFLFDESKY